MALTEGPRIVEARRHLIKSCRPEIFEPGERFAICPNGPVFDRAFMVVDAISHEFRTQRARHPGFRSLALVQPSLNGDQLVLNADDFSEARMPLSAEGRPETVATIWDDQVDVAVFEEGSEWMSDFLSKNVLLVRQLSLRAINRPYVPKNAYVSLADRNHLHGLSLETLAEFNEGLGGTDVTASAGNFRPNLLMHGVGPRGENNIVRARIGKVEIARTIPCERCDMPGVNQQTAQLQKAITKLLGAHYKPHTDRPPLFGEQFRVVTPGTLTVGDPLEILEQDERGYGRKYWEDA